MANQVAKHDYIARVEVSKGNFRYFYTQAEYDAYLHKDKPKQEDPTQKKSSFKEELSKRASSAKEEVKKKYSSTEDLISSMKNVTTDKIKSVSKEYQEEKDYNSKKNIYPEQTKTQESKPDKKAKSFLDKMGDKIADFAKEVSDAGKKFIDSVKDLYDNYQEKKQEEKRAEERAKKDKIADETDAVLRKAKADNARQVHKNTINESFDRAQKNGETLTLPDGTDVLIDPESARLFHKDDEGTIYYTSPTKIKVDRKGNIKDIEFTPFANVDEYGNDHTKSSWLKKVDSSSVVEQRNDAERKAEIEKYQKDEPDYLKDLKKYDGVRSYDEIQDNLNERFHTESGYQNNCIFSSAAYELECRGYDVDVRNVDNIIRRKKPTILQRIFGIEGDAIDLDNSVSYGHNPRDPYTVIVQKNPLDTIYENPDTRIVVNEMDTDVKVNDPKYHEKVQVTRKDIEKMYPPNTRGNLNVLWLEGSGHSMIFEIDKNGEMIIRDTQSHQTYTGNEIDELLRMAKPQYVSVTRTDNLKFRKEIGHAVRSN